MSARDFVQKNLTARDSYLPAVEVLPSGGKELRYIRDEYLTRNELHLIHEKVFPSKFFLTYCIILNTVLICQHHIPPN